VQKTHGIRRTFRVKPTGEIELRVPGVPRARLIAPEECLDEKILQRCEDRAHDAESAEKNTQIPKPDNIFALNHQLVYVWNANLYGYSHPPSDAGIGSLFHPPEDGLPQDPPPY